MINDGNEENGGSDSLASANNHASRYNAAVNGTVSAGASPLSNPSSFDHFKKESDRKNCKTSPGQATTHFSNTIPVTESKCDSNQITKTHEMNSTNLNLFNGQECDTEEGLNKRHQSHASTSVVNSVSHADTSSGCEFGKIDIENENMDRTSSSNITSPRSTESVLLVEEGTQSRNSPLHQNGNGNNSFPPLQGG